MQFVFDALTDPAAEGAGVFVGHVIRADDDADFFAGLNGVGVGDSWETVGNIFETTYALNVTVHGVGASPGSCCGDGIGDFEKTSIDVVRGNLVV